jgi:hypothetical protein
VDTGRGTTAPAHRLLELNLRGVNARVVEPGVAHAGDEVVALLS